MNDKIYVKSTEVSALIYKHYNLKLINQKIVTSPIKLLLINTTGEEEKRLWETTYTQFFQERPLSESTSSNFKIQMIQVFNIKKEQACILK